MDLTQVKVEKDLVIIGGGIPGIVHAIQSARLGLKVALVNNRGFIGGNASAEIAVCVSGATGTQEFNYFARETGVLEELILENLHRNRMGNRWIWDGVLMDALLAEENIELFANTNIDEVQVEDGQIVSASGTQDTTCKRITFFAPLFADDTGDGNLGYMAGAEFRYGREGKQEFGERIAPDEPDQHVLPSTLNFTARDMGKPVKYIPPKFALDLTKTDILKYRVIPPNNFSFSQWFYEIDGDKDQIADAEEIIQHHRNLVYGIWDYIKNSGKYPSENYDLEYVSSIPGKRESRRLMGDHILIESDIIDQKDFEDTVGYGGWSIDLHAIRGFYATEPINKHIFLKGIYQIPYRCGYSKNIKNLFVEGRCMSTSHVGFGSTRVMATLATLSQANAFASYLCKKYNTTPRGVYEEHLEELQRLLLKNDQYIVGKKYEDPDNLAPLAKVTVSSVKDLAITAKDGDHVMEKDLAISVPVLKEMTGISLLLKINEPVNLSYWVGAPEKGENYNPAKKVFENKIAVDQTNGFEWISFPVSVTLEKPANLFFALMASDKVEYAWSNSELTGVITTYRQEVHSDNVIDVDTLEMKADMWYHLRRNLCFKMDTNEPVFSGENLIDGYARPYQGMHIWQSKGVANEYFKLEFPEEKQVKEMVLIFDSDLDKYYRTFHEEPNAEVPNLVKDYTVYYKNSEGELVEAVQVKNNYQRVNTIALPDVKTSELKVVFHETNGQKHIGVYSVRVY